MIKRKTIVLHTFVIISIALSFIYNPLSPEGVFFIAHDSEPIDIFLLMVMVSIGVPLLLAAALSLIALLFSRLTTLSVVGSIFPGFLILSLIIVNTAAQISPLAAWSSALFVAIGLTASYLKYPPFRSVISVAAIGLVALPASFAMSGNIRGLLFQADHEQTFAADVPADIPIVWLIFDGVPLAMLLDSGLQVDRKLFPNFARLADMAYWFRNVTTSYMSTNHSVPVAISGTVIERKTNRPYDFERFPRNIFTMFGDDRRIIAYEPVTRLCPPSLCEKRSIPTGLRLRRLFNDVKVVALHMVLPNATAFGVPPLGDRWADFETDQGSAQRGSKLPVAYWTFGRIETFKESVEEIPAGNPALLYFHHIIFPHPPYQFFNDGRYYNLIYDTPKGLDGDGIWGESGYLAKLGYQRHLYQAGYADQLLGLLLDKLEETQLFEKALIVVMADHGTSYHAGRGRRDFRAGQGRRESQPIEDIALVPLFIKVPGQRKGLVSDAAVQTTDIMPTVLRVLGDEPPGDMTGRVLLDAKGFIELSSVESRTRTIRHWISLKRILLPSDLLTRLQKAVERKYKIFGRNFSWESLRISDQRHAVLLGKRVKDFTVKNSSGAYIYITSDPLKGQSNPDWLPQAVIDGVVKDIDFAQDLELAIVANRVVQAVVPLIELDDTLSFSALLPLAAFDQGAPDIEFFLIRSEADGAIALETFENSKVLAGAEKYTLYLGNPKGPTIVSSNGDVIRIVDGALRGYIDHLTQNDKRLLITGWAVEPKARRPAERILFFLDGDYLFWAKPSHARPGPARWAFKDDSIADDDSIAKIGYKVLAVAGAFPDGLRGGIRAYAVSGDGRATELKKVWD